MDLSSVLTSSAFSRVEGGRAWPGRHVSAHPAALHDDDDTPERRDVLSRVAVEGDEIGFAAGGHGPDLALQLEPLGGAARGGDERIHRILPRFLNAMDQLLLRASLRARHAVRPQNDTEDRIATAAPSCRAPRTPRSGLPERCFHRCAQGREIEWLLECADGTEQSRVLE